MMPGRQGVILLLFAIATVAAAAATAHAAELRIIHHGYYYRYHHYRYAFWRFGPQDCFLTPDEVVTLDALGPYCSSPRGHHRWAGPW